MTYPGTPRKDAPTRQGPGLLSAFIGLHAPLARQRGLEHVYLGYRVQGCASLRYKGAFGPHELLEGRPAPDEAPRWRAPGTERKL